MVVEKLDNVGGPNLELCQGRRLRVGAASVGNGVEQLGDAFASEFPAFSRIVSEADEFGEPASRGEIDGLKRNVIDGRSRCVSIPEIGRFE